MSGFLQTNFIILTFPLFHVPGHHFLLQIQANHYKKNKFFSVHEKLMFLNDNKTLWAIWYHFYNLKNVKNTHGGVLLLETLFLFNFFKVYHFYI